MSKPVEVEFLMKDKLTPGMNKAEREALELRNTVRLLEAELERLRLAGETAAPNLDQSANIAQIHALEKQLEELRGKLKLLQEESESLQPYCLRLAHYITIIHSRLASNAVVNSLFDGASTHRTIYPLLDARSDPNVVNLAST